MHVNARAIIERETADGVEIVVQIRNEPAAGGKLLELPGGRIEEYEPLLDALRREVREETGLTLVQIAGAETRIETVGADAQAECLAPFAVYQTLAGPVDSLGVYFRCRATGELLASGDDTEQIRWLSVQRVAQWLKDAPEQFSWVDRAGLVFYLRQRGE